VASKPQRPVLCAYACAIVDLTRFVMSPDGRLCVRRALEGPPAITSTHQPSEFPPSPPRYPTALST
jgi:hypothetical protein